MTQQHCQNCGATLDTDGAFCQNCGAPIASQIPGSRRDLRGRRKLITIIAVVCAVIVLSLSAFFVVKHLVYPTTSPDPIAETLSVEDYVQLGNHYLRDGDYENAILAYKNAMEIDEKYVAAYRGLAKAYVGLEDYKKALETLQEGYDLTGDKRLLLNLIEIEEEYVAPANAPSSEPTEETPSDEATAAEAPAIETPVGEAPATSDIPSAAASTAASVTRDSYSVYYTILSDLVDKYGLITQASVDELGLAYNISEKAFVAYAELLDFDKDGINELFVVYSEGTPSTYYSIYCFDANTKQAVLVYKANAGSPGFTDVTYGIILTNGVDGKVYNIEGTAFTFGNSEFDNRGITNYNTVVNGKWMTVLSAQSYYENYEEDEIQKEEFYINGQPVTKAEYDSERKKAFVSSRTISLGADAVNNVLTELRLFTAP